MPTESGKDIMAIAIVASVSVETILTLRLSSYSKTHSGRFFKQLWLAGGY
jgi:DNA-binding CsgD family transcriptional regulator